MDGLAATVQQALRRDPLAGDVFVSGCTVPTGQVLTWDGSGLCLYYKRLEAGRFTWPAREALTRIAALYATRAAQSTLLMQSSITRTLGPSSIYRNDTRKATSLSR